MAATSCGHQSLPGFNELRIATLTEQLVDTSRTCDALREQVASSQSLLLDAGMRILAAEAKSAAAAKLASDMRAHADELNRQLAAALRMLPRDKRMEMLRV